MEISPDYPLAHLNTGMTLEGTGALQEAIKSYQQALAALPTIRSVGRGLLETCHPPTHAYTRRHTRARKCTHARKRTPAHMHAQTRLRLQAIFLSPDYPDAYRKLGSIYLRTGGIQHATWHTACHVNQSQRWNVHACMHATRRRDRDVRSVQPLSCIGELGGGSTPSSHRAAHCTQHEDALTDGVHKQLAGSEYRLLVAARACTAVRQA